MKNRILIWNNDAQRFLAKQQCVENVIVVDTLDVTRNRAVSLDCACSAEIVYCLLNTYSVSARTFPAGLSCQ